MRIPEQNVPVPRQLLGLLGRDASGSELVERHVGRQQLVNDLARHADVYTQSPTQRGCTRCAGGGPALLLLAARGGVPVRRGKGGRRREVGMDHWG